MKLSTGLAAMLAMIATPAIAQDTILYRGGPIVTMDGDTPTTVEAVVTRGDRIAFAGSEKAARKEAGKDVAVRDLKGATMLPGFIDAHSHFTVATMSASQTGAPFTMSIAQTMAPVQIEPSTVRSAMSSIL